MNKAFIYEVKQCRMKFKPITLGAQMVYLADNGRTYEQTLEINYT